MTFRRTLHRVALAAMLSSCLASPALAGEGVLGLPAVGPMAPEQMTRGPVHCDFGAQTVPNMGLIGSFNFSGVFDTGEINTSLMMNPSNPLGFFVADMNAAFVGQTGRFLPINLMPFMGIGAAMFMYDPPSGGSTKAGLPFYVPIGLRYTLPLGGLSVGAEVSYMHGLGDMLGEQVDPSRWRYEGSVRLGFLHAAVYNESGPLLGGAGAKLGFNF